MIILTIRTDKPEAELGLYKDTQQLTYYTWLAHRQLAETLHLKIKGLLAESNYKLHDISGIVVYKGPGSFTGLRIGISVANALSSALSAALVGETGDDWKEKAINRIVGGYKDKQVLPEYGAPVHITPSKQ